MIALVQRTKYASVTIENNLYSKTGRGYLVLLGVNVNDSEKDCELLASKIAKLRVFEDENGKMNLSGQQLVQNNEEFEITVVSQFTLCAECKGQNRPSFINAARPEQAVPLYEKFIDILSNQYGFVVKTGVFGADMQVNLLNDGPVTIILDTEKL